MKKRFCKNNIKMIQSKHDIYMILRNVKRYI